MFGNEARKGLAVLIGMNLRAEDVMQVLVLEHGGRDRGRDQRIFFCCSTLAASGTACRLHKRR